MVIDFSHHSAVNEVLRYAEQHDCAAVIGTTGHTPEEKALILDAAQRIPVFYSGNMSLGIAVLCRLAKQAAQFFPDADIEILEIHHNRKVDAPSGTAKMLFEAVKQARPGAEAVCGRAGEGKREENQVGIASLRMGNVVGVHEVHITTQTQSLTLRHDAQDRGMFADGAVEAARFLVGKPAGLYNMEHILEEM
jgi:4-hydroxy-tetrahydrodipicolinate reductase